MAYDEGNKYTDFKDGDKVAAGGIAALIVGGLILKKGGILAIIFGLFKPLLAFGAKIIAVGYKFIVLIVAGIAGGIKRIFGGKKETPLASPGSQDKPEA